MAPTVPWGIPDRARAGDTWLWKETFPEYPASEGWTPQYAIRGVERLEWSSAYAVAVGEEWTITIPASATEKLDAGRYEYSIVLVGSGTYSGRTHTLASGLLIVLPNLTTAKAGDRQTYNERTLAVIRARMEGRMSSDIESYMIGSRQVVKIPIGELIKLEATFAARVRRERSGGQLERIIEVHL